MALVQIFSVITNDFGPLGPVKKLYAVGAESKDAARELLKRRLKLGESATWVDARTLGLAEAEVRLI